MKVTYIFLWRFCESRKYLLLSKSVCDTIKMLSIFRIFYRTGVLVCGLCVFFPPTLVPMVTFQSPHVKTYHTIYTNA